MARSLVEAIPISERIMPSDEQKQIKRYFVLCLYIYIYVTEYEKPNIIHENTVIKI